MKTVVISGSRSITRLPDKAIACLELIVAQGMQIQIGDCPLGVDRLVQKWLWEHSYEHVVVWTQNNRTPRFIANREWNTQHTGFNWSARDEHMCKYADFGLAIWDGKSPGTRNNIKRVRLTRVILDCGCEEGGCTCGTEPMHGD